MNDTSIHALVGDERQIRFLQEAVAHYKMVLFRFGGLDVHVDNFIRERDESMSAWAVKLEDALKR